MALHPLAGKPAPAEMLIDVEKLLESYRRFKPDPGRPDQRVAFGTSGHRGCASRATFNDAHVAAVCQAACRVRAALGADGPMFLGRDTHAVSEPAERTALEVLAANGVEVRLPLVDGATPTPVISHAILRYNRGRKSGLADGIVITPSHNPPEDGGIKYNPPGGGPAEPKITGEIEKLANELLQTGEIKRIPYEKARLASCVRRHDLHGGYVRDLESVLDMELIAQSGLELGADPLGGASLPIWQGIAGHYRLNLEVVNPRLDPTFGFVPLDHDGRIRMDCSSPHAMAGLLEMRERFDVAFGNDPDADRFGVVTPAGLLNPNRHLAAAAAYLLAHRPQWSGTVAVGKTLVSSALIDRAVQRAGRRVVEVPVGFKWFVEGLLSGALGFAGEESAGASLLRKDGTVWTTDKDGIAVCLLAAEMTARTGKDPAQLADELEREVGRPYYARRDVPIDEDRRRVMKKLTPAAVTRRELGGERILHVLDRAPGNDEPIGGLKIITAEGWCAVRPSGTEPICKVYAESFKSQQHLEELLQQAWESLEEAFRAAGLK